ncbi:PREDICTED: uncharacterized protein LOC108444805 [Corvus brachyrhynchos]|uniref:uncharacterized protein LOC108444805 n=1 Tax=Corvus brachyrhynchos TaxID=85066 RepID=UPI00081676C8|nr:PREDICTED: uncharacterized protein LOC108444805 [Corvus brachyrhynchos]
MLRETGFLWLGATYHLGKTVESSRFQVTVIQAFSHQRQLFANRFITSLSTISISPNCSTAAAVSRRVDFRFVVPCGERPWRCTYNPWHSHAELLSAALTGKLSDRATQTAGEWLWPSWRRAGHTVLHRVFSRCTRRDSAVGKLQRRLPGTAPPNGPSPTELSRRTGRLQPPGPSCEIRTQHRGRAEGLSLGRGPSRSGPGHPGAGG